MSIKALPHDQQPAPIPQLDHLNQSVEISVRQIAQNNMLSQALSNQNEQIVDNIVNNVLLKLDETATKNVIDKFEKKKKKKKKKKKLKILIQLLEIIFLNH